MFARPQSVLWVGETIDTISSHREEELLQGLSAAAGCLCCRTDKGGCCYQPLMGKFEQQ